MPLRPVFFVAASALAAAAFVGCSFDYGDLSEEAESGMPDLVMSEVEYVRVESGSPSVRLQADTISRYEKERRMTAEAARFAQYGKDGAEGAMGDAVSASVDLDTWDVTLTGGVAMSVPKEDIQMETDELKWVDKDRLLLGSGSSSTLVMRGDGSFLSGLGFRADARSKRWSFASSVSGSYVSDDDGKKEPDDAAEAASSGEDSSADGSR